MGLLHVALCRGWAWVQVPPHSFGCQVGAPFEETTSDSFEECGDAWATQGLMGKLDAVVFGSDGVGEETHLFQWRFFFSDFVAFPLLAQTWALAHTGTARIDVLEKLTLLVVPKILHGG